MRVQIRSGGLELAACLGFKDVATTVKGSVGTQILVRRCLKTVASNGGDPSFSGGRMALYERWVIGATAQIAAPRDVAP
jgi:hypothetical protein